MSDSSDLIQLMLLRVNAARARGQEHVVIIDPEFTEPSFLRQCVSVSLHKHGFKVSAGFSTYTISWKALLRDCPSGLAYRAREG